MKAFKASATGAGNVTEPTPRAAAEKFFATFPNKRKCSVFEGEVDGVFFVMKISLSKDGTRPRSWKDVTKKTAADLPAVA